MIRLAKQLGFMLVGPMLVVGVAGCAAGTPSVSPAPSIRPSVTSSQRPAPSASPATSSCPTASTAAWNSLCWSAPVILPNALFVNDVVTFEGQLYALGAARSSDGTQEVALWRSNDGATWTLLTQGGTTFADAQVRQLLATSSGLVAWGSVGQPVCSGSGEGQTCGPLPEMLWTSPDGSTWTRIADSSMFTGATISAVTIGQEGLVAVGETGWDKPAIWLSDTGAAWRTTSLPTSTFAHGHFYNVRAIGSGYVLAGSVGGQAPISGGVAAPSTGTAAAWWSPDGLTWTKATLQGSGGAGASLGGIAVGAQGLVAVGSESGGKEGALGWVSSDGRTWRPVALLYAGAPSAAPGEPTLPAMNVCDDGTHLIGLDVDSRLVLRLWISSDGIGWHQLPASGATDTLPLSPGEVGSARYDAVFLVPGGLVVTGFGPQGSPVLMWHVIASQ
jgi:hypothetical protein